MPRSLHSHGSHHPFAHDAPFAHLFERFDAAHRAELATHGRDALLAAAGVTGVTLAIALTLWVLYAFLGAYAGVAMP